MTFTFKVHPGETLVHRKCGTPWIRVLVPVLDGDTLTPSAYVSLQSKWKAKPGQRPFCQTCGRLPDELALVDFVIQPELEHARRR